MLQHIIQKGFTLLFIFLTGFVFSQREKGDTLYNNTVIDRLQIYDGFDLPSDYHTQYRNALRRVRRVYPLALEAARIIDSLDNELEDINKNRKQNKLMRKTHKSLKNDFKFLLKDLYVSEGIVLTKLIYRETGMTVTEIISQYKSAFQASLYTGLAGFFDQDLNAIYYPNTEDFVIECVIRDIKSGKVYFDPNFEIVSKEEYKKEQRASKKRRKENKAKRKKNRKESSKTKDEKFYRR